ncbi:SCO-spondin-like isoform X1 [Saccostrea cucullata]|uniref:SCO-spondin-like isoform X1 n=1 Tax=Saccostrea cuccullata TaxID=36930 RepID=UPI002ED5F1DE
MGFMRFSTECPMYGKETQYCTVNCSESTTTSSSAGDWGPWGAFSACDKTCGGGVHMRYRACRIGSCVGDSLQSSTCNSQHCPVHHTAHSSTKAPTSSPPVSSTTSRLSTNTSAATQVGIVSSTRAPSIGTTTMFPNTTISPTSGLSERTCKVCGDYENGISCDIRSIYIGPEVTCEAGKAFCMTDIISDGSGKEQVFKRCVNEAVCRTQWLSQTSDQDYCVQYGKVVVSDMFSCHFCCTSDECNQGLVPDSSTFYTGS